MATFLWCLWTGPPTLGPGSEEYLDSEKYAIRHWDLDRAESLKNFITRVNRIRKGHRALQSHWTQRFHAIDNAELIAYSKHSEEAVEIVLAMNLDPAYTQAGWLQLPLADLDIAISSFPLTVAASRPAYPS